MRRAGDRLYFRMGVGGWGHGTRLLSFFQIMGIYPLLASVPSVHSALGNSCPLTQENKRQADVVMSRTHTQMPRQGAWRNPGWGWRGRQYRHPASLGSGPLPCTSHLAVVTSGTQETEALPSPGGSVGRRSCGQQSFKG